MINVSEERPISLSEAARLLPRGRKQRPTHPSTILRWIRRGSNGCRLEGIRIGGRWATSAEALDRYFRRLTSAKDGDVESASRATRVDPQTSNKLDALGF